MRTGTVIEYPRAKETDGGERKTRARYRGGRCHFSEKRNLHGSRPTPVLLGNISAVTTDTSRDVLAVESGRNRNKEARRYSATRETLFAKRRGAPLPSFIPSPSLNRNRIERGCRVCFLLFLDTAFLCRIVCNFSVLLLSQNHAGITYHQCKRPLLVCPKHTRQHFHVSGRLFHEAPAKSNKNCDNASHSFASHNYKHTQTHKHKLNSAGRKGAMATTGRFDYLRDWSRKRDWNAKSESRTLRRPCSRPRSVAVDQLRRFDVSSWIHACTYIHVYTRMYVYSCM